MPNEVTNVDWDVIQEPTSTVGGDELVDPLSRTDDAAVFSSQTYVDIYTSNVSADEETIERNNRKEPLKYIPEKVNITVTDPTKEVEQQGTYISYLVKSDAAQVRRRFQDFAWLHNLLYANYSACFIPPLPDKHLIGYVKGDRFSTEFTEKRRICLERFLQRIARHPILSKSSAFTLFLESTEFRLAKESQETVIDTISDSLLNVFSKIGNPDPRFMDMKEKNKIMEEQLDILNKTLLRANKRTVDLSLDYKELSHSACTLSAIDPTYTVLLDKFIPAMDRYTDSLDQASMEDTKWQLGIHDYMAYCHSVEDVLKLRDQKQLDFEGLSDYLKSTRAQRDDAVHGRIGDGGVVAYITDKLLEITGSNPQRTRRARIARLDDQIRELDEAVKQTREISAEFSKQVVKENTLFNEVKNIELHNSMKSYTNAKVEFYQNGLNIWEELLEKLENNPL